MDTMELGKTTFHETNVTNLNFPFPFCVDMSKKKKKNILNR
jgi:hypothetical protein